MKNRAQELFNKELLKLLLVTSKNEFDNSLSKIASLADIVDQTGDENSANKIDDILKQAGFWSSLFTGMAAGGGVGLWDAFKSGKFKENFTNIVKKALIAGTTAVAIDYIIKWLDGVPVIGSVLKELQGADKIRGILEGVVGGAVAESDLANKLVDKAIDAIEDLLGFGNKAQSKPKEAPVAPAPTPAAPKAQVEKPEQDGSSAPFQIGNLPGAKAASVKHANEVQECTKCWSKMESKGTPIFKEFADRCSACLNKRFYALRYLAGYAGGHLEDNIRKEFNKLESVAPSHVTGESHNFGARGRQDKQNNVDILNNKKMMTFLTPDEVKLTLEYNKTLGK